MRLSTDKEEEILWSANDNKAALKSHVLSTASPGGSLESLVDGLFRQVMQSRQRAVVERINQIYIYNLCWGSDGTIWILQITLKMNMAQSSIDIKMPGNFVKCILL